jgi:hypothetical protein
MGADLLSVVQSKIGTFGGVSAPLLLFLGREAAMPS